VGAVGGGGGGARGGGGGGGGPRGVSVGEDGSVRLWRLPVVGNP
jgi:hypothetical protein